MCQQCYMAQLYAYSICYTYSGNIHVITPGLLKQNRLLFVLKLVVRLILTYPIFFTFQKLASIICFSKEILLPSHYSIYSLQEAFLLVLFFCLTSVIASCQCSSCQYFVWLYFIREKDMVFKTIQNPLKCHERIVGYQTTFQCEKFSIKIMTFTRPHICNPYPP